MHGLVELPILARMSTGRTSRPITCCEDLPPKQGSSPKKDFSNYEIQISSTVEQVVDIAKEGRPTHQVAMRRRQ